jgi:hypothetical protein
VSLVAALAALSAAVAGIGSGDDPHAAVASDEKMKRVDATECLREIEVTFIE